MLLFFFACAVEKQDSEVVEDPTIDSIQIVPAEVFTGSELSCVSTISNPSQQILSFQYEWFAGDTKLGDGGELNLQPDLVQPTDDIICSLKMFTDDQEFAASATVTVSNTLPVIDEIDITPSDEVKIGTELICSGAASDADLEDVGISFKWYRGDELLAEGTSLVLSSSLVSKRDEVTCVLSAEDGYGGIVEDKTTVVVGNSEPLLEAVLISPESPNTKDELRCEASATDIDGDNITLSYEWTVDGVAGSSTTDILLGPFTVGAQVSCLVTPDDGEQTGASLSASTQIENTLPTVDAIEILPATAYADSLLQCTAQPFDFDDEEITLAYRWTNTDGVELGTSDTLQLTPSIAPVGSDIWCAATPADPHGQGTAVSSHVIIENTDPSVAEMANIVANPQAVTTGELTCSALFSDLDDGDLSASYQWLAGTTVLGSGPTYTISALETDPEDTIVCVATASDNNGASVSSDASIVVENTVPEVTSLSLSPDPLYSQDDVVCSAQAMDIDEQTIALAYAWDIDGVSQNEQSDILAGPFEVGSVVTCSVIPNDGLSDGIAVTESIEVQNTLPIISAISFDTSEPKTNDTIQAIVVTSDVDGQVVTVSHQWFVDGVMVYDGGETLDGSVYFDKDDEVYVVVRPNDGVDDGLPVTSATIVVANSAPQLVSVAIDPSMAEVGDDVTCIAEPAIDDDGDGVVYSYEWVDPDGVVHQDTQSTIDISDMLVSVATEGTWTCRVTPSDGIDDGTPQEATTDVYGNCSFELTDWSEISSELYDIEDLLPTIPSHRLVATWDEPIHEILMQSIQPEARNGQVGDPLSCDTPAFWDQDRVVMGPFVDGDNPHCRIQLRDNNLNDKGLFAFNRHRWSSGEKITGEPAWLQFRFTVPENHQSTRFRYEVNWSRLFGSAPSDCHGDDEDVNGDCYLAALSPDESWDEYVPPGLFILWGEAGGCGGWTISGPHAPIEDIEYSGTKMYTIDVPEEVQDAEELVVSMFVYHQYPGGCEGTNCISGASSPYNIAFHRADLFTEQIFEPAFEPPIEHPRLFGDDETWMTEQQKFVDMDCLGTDWPVNSAWGGLTNIRNNWDLITTGGMACEGTVPSSLVDVEFASVYLDGTASWNVTQAVKALHLIRRERACQETGIGTCWFDPQEVDDLAVAIISVEMARLPSIVWNSFSFEFDLRTREPMRVYTLLADVLWDELSTQQHEQLADAMGIQIDGFLQHFDDTHWAVFNGNNWTPVLAEGALYWAITYYYEDERAPDVARLALYSLWLHRHSYLSDGVYNEGLLMYSQVSFDPIIAVSRLADFGFGIDIMSPPWERMSDFADWALAFMATDGYTIDFGDSWAKKGWGTFMPLLAHMINPATGKVDQPPEPCFAYQFFNNKYYFYGVDDPWKVHTALAQDWPAILANCTTGNQPLQDIETRVWDVGGWGSIRIGLPNSTTLGSQVTSGPSLYAQHDQVMLATSAIPNTQSHTELDFGTVVWLAYGNRLLVDFGYGTIGNKQYQTLPDYDTFDNNPTGHNTLVIPEAYENGDLSTNTSQIDGEVGTISETTIDGHTMITLDGSAVYGRDNVDLGWLEYFERSLLPFDDGTILLIDSILVRADRGLISPEEYWLTYTGSSTASTCSNTMSGMQKVFAADNVTLIPTCSRISKYDMAESAGRIFGTSIEGGSFVEMSDVTLTNRLNQVDTKSQFKWTPDNPLDSDIRVFALVSDTTEANLPTAEWDWSTCGVDDCVTLTLDSVDYVTLRFAQTNGQYILTEIDKW